MTTSLHPTDTRLRWLESSDIPVVAEIDRTSHQIPWGHDDFGRFLDGTDSSPIAIVAECRGGMGSSAGTIGGLGNFRRRPAIAGYCVYSMLKFGFRIERLAVRERFRRRTVGSQLIARLVRRINMQRRTHIRAAVGEWNLAGQQFLRSAGFRCTRTIRPDEVERSPEIDCDVQRRALLASLGDQYFFTLRYRPCDVVRGADGAGAGGDRLQTIEKLVRKVEG